MSLKLASLLFASLTVTASLVGCAADTTADLEDEDLVSSEDAVKAAGIQPGTFKLYATPHHQPNPGCDVHTSLELSNRSGARAALREVVGGFCEIFVDPQPREYRLRFEGTSCGSKIYKGTKRVAGKTRNITVTDHRTRTCRDLQPAKIIVQETDRNGAPQTKYSFDGAAPTPAVGTWLTYAPKQCGTNPWNGAQPAPGQDGSYLQGEKGEVDNFFRGKGIALAEVGFAYPSEPRMVCMACQCARGDTLVVHAKTPADAAKLVSDFGFAEMDGDALTTSPRQCGTNPWEGGVINHDDRVESKALSTWAKGAGAELAEAGFLDPTEGRAVCAACQCARGDLAIVFPKTAAGTNKLVSLGFSRVEN